MTSIRSAATRTWHAPLRLVVLLTFVLTSVSALASTNGNKVATRMNRRAWLAIAATIVATPAHAADMEPQPLTPLTDEEMEARVARKMELMKKAARGQAPYVSAMDVRSDVNPEASDNLRSRSYVENAKMAIQKQEEMKSRDKQKKRDDLCEMLGRGC